MRVRAVNTPLGGIEWEPEEDHLQHVDAAMAAWKQKGQPHDYLRSLTNLSDKQRAEIFLAASLRHKGKEPKNNPYNDSE